MVDPDPIATEIEESTPAVDRRDSSQANKFRRAIFDVPVTLQVSLGKTSMTIAEIMSLDVESVVKLTANIDDPVYLMVDRKIVAFGELVETGEGGLAVRITEVPDSREDDS